MKKILSALIFLITFSLNAQTTCETAQPFCAGGVSGVTFPATTSVTTAQTGPNYGCLGSTPNPAWYYLQISTSGNLDILIQGQIVSPPGPGQDVDFICWGPFNSLAGICNSLTATNIVDCSYSGSFTETLNIPTGVTGQYYLVLITNFANITQDILFTQYAGTGSTNCGLVATNSKICAGSAATLVANNSGSLTSPNYSINPGGLSNTTGTFIVSPLVTSVYTLYVSGLNSLSIPITQTAVSTVTVNPLPLSVPTVTNSTCNTYSNAFNLGLNFNPPSPVPSYTVSWANLPTGINSSTQTILSSTQASLNFGIQGGPYSATITAAGGCSTVANFSVNPAPDPALITLSPSGLNHTLTCYQPVLTLTSMVSTNNYTWTNGVSAPIVGQLGVFSVTNLGSWTIQAVNPGSGCTASLVVGIGQNFSAPVAIISPTFQNITCSLTTISPIIATANPTVNVTHQFYSPLGGNYSATTYSASYLPGGPGTYSHCIVNDANGCSTCKTFTVASNQGFPTFSVNSPQNYTLGCTTTSVATINITNASATNSLQAPTGGPVSYTLLSPGSPTATPSGTLSGLATYTVNVPGTWTVITKDNTSFCETRMPISILQNTIAPDIFVISDRTILDCFVPRVTLKGQSASSNIKYNWSFPGTPGNLPSDSISVSVNSLTPTNSLVANYTLTITDNSSTCKSTTIIPVYQNIYKPHATISNGGVSALTCITGTIMLTNQSTTGIPPGSIFTTNQIIQGYLWQGPSPQEPLQVSSTYLAGMVGVYTLTVKDLNNGCTSNTVITIKDDRIYPSISRSNGPDSFVLDCGAGSRTITPTISVPNTNLTYVWTTPAGAVVSSNTSAVISTSNTGLYKVLVIDKSNGCASSGEVTVVNGTLNAGFEPSSSNGYAPMDVKFRNTSQSTIDSLGIRSYWNFGNGTFSATPEASVITNAHYDLAGTFTVTLYVRKGSCMDTIKKIISVEIPSQMVVPNVFTPNGDNVNDVFFIKATNLDEITMLIYDRWGHKVFDLVSDKGNLAWDGKNQFGKEVAEGTYFYIIKAKGKDGNSFEKNGTISLFR